jgi:hypothetical protein
VKLLHGLLALALGCASSAAAPGPEAPRYTLLRPYAPEELSRDVVECSEQARSALAARESLWRESPEAQRRALHEATTECMHQRGWRRI